MHSKKMIISKVYNDCIFTFYNEISTLTSIKSLFILSLLGFSYKKSLILVTDFISNGDLHSNLNSSDRSSLIKPHHKTKIAIGIAQGMSILHRLGYIHRNLKSLNILLDKHYTPVICDFGLSLFIDLKHLQSLNGEVGTAFYMAPELLNGNNYSTKVDVYSYGWILWELINHKIHISNRKASDALVNEMISAKNNKN
jgi:serine/threonine protein kinase